MKIKGAFLLSILFSLSILKQVNSKIDVEDFSTNSDQVNLIIKCESPSNISDDAVIKIDACVFNIRNVGDHWDILIYPGDFKKVVLDPGEYYINAAGHKKTDHNWRKTWFAAKYGLESTIRIRVYPDRQVFLNYELPRSSLNEGKVSFGFGNFVGEDITTTKPELGLEDIALKELVEFPIERREVKGELHQIANGAELEITRSRTIKHTLNIDSKANGSVDLSLKTGAILDLMVAVEGQIKGELENNLGQTFQDTETIEMKIKLDGKISNKWQVYWYDKIHKGIARFEDKNGKIYELPYEFKAASEVKVLPVK